MKSKARVALPVVNFTRPAALFVALLALPVLAQDEHSGPPGSQGVSLHSAIPPALLDSSPAHVPAKITECEAGQCGVWEFHGKAGTARWPSGARATLTVERFGFDGVTIRRNDHSGSTTGFVAVYTGKVVGNQLVGDVLWSWPGHWRHTVNGKWAATILEPADYSIIDPNVACSSEFAISATEALERGVMATEAHEAKKGACWLRRSAQAGNSMAQGMLAAIDYKGVGVPVNWIEAVDFAQKAAAQGNYVAERCLSLMYGNGDGLAKDSAKADFWRTRAERDKLAAMKVEQQEAQQLAQQQEWARRYQAQQAELQHRAMAQIQFHQNAQSLAVIGLLLGAFASDFDSAPSPQCTWHRTLYGGFTTCAPR